MRCDIVLQYYIVGETGRAVPSFLGQPSDYVFYHVVRNGSHWRYTIDREQPQPLHPIKLKTLWS
jgi:hypothetical protein